MLVAPFFEMPAHIITLYECLALGFDVGAAFPLQKENVLWFPAEWWTHRSTQRLQKSSALFSHPLYSFSLFAAQMSWQ